MASFPDNKVVTYEEWLTMAEVEGEEVVNGEIRILPPARVTHAMIAAQIQLGLAGQLDPKTYYVFTGSFGIVIQVKPLICRTPDLAVYDRATMNQVDGYLRSAPELAIEVLSPRNTPQDMRLKIAEYSAVGFPELWVMAPESRSIEIWLLRDEQLRRSAVTTEGLLHPTRLAVAIDVATIWPA